MQSLILILIKLTQAPCLHINMVKFFVTDDGAETDLDLGHYERFIDEKII